MKQKGSNKQVKAPNFWGNKLKQVNDELKKMIYEQYLSDNSLYVYCDCSVNVDSKQMATACTYVGLSRIVVKQQFVYPPSDCIDKPVFAELKALIFALSHFEKHMMHGCKNVIFYTDVDDIAGFLNKSITFKKNASLKKVQTELILLYQKVKKKHPDIAIDILYLQLNEKINNPFHRSSHNACNRMLSKNTRK